jgi:hypothetical protein
MPSVREIEANKGYERGILAVEVRQWRVVGEGGR